MPILRWNELQAVPWKNGQGITRELAKEHRSGGFVWRLSIADVASDGPFSRFEGMRRILTVVEGNGMELISSDVTLQADLGVPVEFDGELEITSSSKGGPLRDLNLIFDPLFCSGRVSLLAGGESLSLRCGNSQIFALYCMRGLVALNNSEALHKGDTILHDEGICEVRIDEGSLALLVKIERLN
jgi:environmental stress-induced protein Ves